MTPKPPKIKNDNDRNKHNAAKKTEKKNQPPQQEFDQ